MQNAKLIFRKNITQANELGALYDYLSGLVRVPVPFDDLLRSQIVYAVSAFDKLLHDLIRIGMVQIFQGLRPATDKYKSERIAIQHLTQLAVGSTPPPAVRFEEIVREKLSLLSFQDPNKIADGLSFIWGEEHKWKKIAFSLDMPEVDVKLKQKLIVTRRNAIVHEADLDPVSGAKQLITRAEAADASQFLLAHGLNICDLIV